MNDNKQQIEARSRTCKNSGELPCYVFGDRVDFTHKFVRKNVSKKDKMPDGKEYTCSNWKVWQQVPYGVSGGIFLGFRTLRNGIREYDSDYGWSFESRENFKAALISPGQRLNPVFVPLDCIET